MTVRKTKHWVPDPSIKVEQFNKDEINSKNLINHLLVFNQSDFSFSLVMELFGTFNGGESLCHPYDTFDVPPGSYKYLDDKGKEHHNVSKFTTTIGIWMYNIFFLRDFNFAFLFGGYINKNIGTDEFDDINDTLAYALLEDKIDMDNYQRYLNYTQYFMPFESVLSPNHTEKMLACTKKLNKKKEELLKKYQDKLNAGDVAAAEDMEKELLAYAEELLKDDPSLDVYFSKAASSWKNNFKNMYIMKGAITNPDPNAKQQFNIATSNLMDGVSADEYSLYANSLATGPYSRSKKTEIGGYWEKLFSAAYQAVNLDPEGSDCKTNEYIEVTLTSKNISMFMYNYIIKANGELEELNLDTRDKYMDKKVKMRFSTHCKSKTGICNKCAGNFFYRRGSRTIGLATVQVPARLKLVAMKAFHDGTVKTSIIDPMKAFGIKK
jgi:hypothetical protein